MGRRFDTKRAAREKGNGEEDYERLKREVKEEFQGDELMFELHLFRALKCLAAGSK